MLSIQPFWICDLLLRLRRTHCAASWQPQQGFNVAASVGAAWGQGSEPLPSAPLPTPTSQEEQEQNIHLRESNDSNQLYSQGTISTQVLLCREVQALLMSRWSIGIELDVLPGKFCTKRVGVKHRQVIFLDFLVHCTLTHPGNWPTGILWSRADSMQLKRSKNGLLLFTGSLQLSFYQTVTKVFKCKIFFLFCLWNL